MNRKETLFLTIGIFLTVIAVVAGNIYHTLTENKIKDKLEIPQVKNYQIDTKLLERLKNAKE